MTTSPPTVTFRMHRQPDGTFHLVLTDTGTSAALLELQIQGHDLLMSLGDSEERPAVLSMLHTSPLKDTGDLPPDDLIMDAAAKAFRVSLRSLCGGERAYKGPASARLVAMVALRELLGWSYPRIARRVGLKHHGNAVYAPTRLAKQMKTNKGVIDGAIRFEKIIKPLREKLENQKLKTHV